MDSNILPYTDSKTSSEEHISTGVLIGIRIILEDIVSSNRIYEMGFYGKPFGVRKPGPNKYSRPLELSLIEGLYLAENGYLRVVDPGKGELEPNELREYARTKIPEFELMYKVYKDLRDRGLVVRSGLKFGADYSVYRKGPGLEHAPFLVHTYRHDELIDPTDLVRSGRLSHSVRKKFVMAIVFQDNVDYVSLEWLRP